MLTLFSPFIGTKLSLPTLHPALQGCQPSKAPHPGRPNPTGETSEAYQQPRPSLQGNRKPVEIIKQACSRVNNRFQGLTKQRCQKPPQFEVQARKDPTGPLSYTARQEWPGTEACKEGSKLLDAVWQAPAAQASCKVGPEPRELTSNHFSFLYM